MTAHISKRMWVRDLVLMAILALALVSAQQTDERCLLDSGGSTQRFFVSEDLPVGSVLGKLSVKGEKRFEIFCVLHLNQIKHEIISVLLKISHGLTFKKVVKNLKLQSSSTHCDILIMPRSGLYLLCQSYHQSYQTCMKHSTVKYQSATLSSCHF